MKKLVIIPMLFACFMSMGQASAGGGKHFIGENFGGGIVFNVSPDGLHGLIAETQDQSNKCSYYDEKKAILNTDNHSAAGKSYTDWRLPTKEELNLLYLQKKVVRGFYYIYWSSTLHNTGLFTYVFYHNFKTGEQSDRSGGALYSIRTIRSF